MRTLRHTLWGIRLHQVVDNHRHLTVEMRVFPGVRPSWRTSPCCQPGAQTVQPNPRAGGPAP